MSRATMTSASPRSAVIGTPSAAALLGTSGSAPPSFWRSRNVPAMASSRGRESVRFISAPGTGVLSSTTPRGVYDAYDLLSRYVRGDLHRLRSLGSAQLRHRAPPERADP